MYRGTCEVRTRPGPFLARFATALQSRSLGNTRPNLTKRNDSIIVRAMGERVIPISEAEAASDFAGLLARVRAGAEVVIESDKLPAAVVRSAEPHVRLLSESLRLAKEHASRAALDEDFARNLEAAINSHRELWNPAAGD
jgi:antitoxin (DNA-binding transcriptional repressor) of toxin-antitoxin stability system